MIDFDGPLRNAWRRSEEQLFAPFDLTRWLMLGFTAWLTTGLQGALGSGTFFFPPSAKNPAEFVNGVQGWASTLQSRGLVDILLVAAVGLTLVLIVLLATTWLGMRGRFMFLDNVVQGHALIVETWRASRVQGNRLFVFYIVVWSQIGRASCRERV